MTPQPLPSLSSRRPYPWRAAALTLAVSALLASTPKWFAHSTSNSTPSTTFLRQLSWEPGDYLAACPPRPALEFLRHAGKDAATPLLGLLNCEGLTPLIKPVAAVAGDRIEQGPQGLRINGVLVAQSKKRPKVPDFQVPWSYVVPAGHVLLLSPRPQSFDSRYFGPVPLASSIPMKPLN